MAGQGLLIGDIFRNAAAAVPDRPAVYFAGDALTFAELDGTANRMARLLQRGFLARGARLMVWAPTSLELAPLFVAAAKLGAIYMPVNPVLGPDEARTMLTAAAPALVVVDGPRLDALRDMTEDVSTAVLTLADLYAAAEATDDVEADDLSEDDPHVVFFTSGSSGRPKGAVISHRVNFLRTHPGALLEPRGVMVCSYPFFHMAAFTIALQQWQARDGVVILPSASAEEICGAIARHGATRLNAAPAVWRRLLTHAAADPSAARALAGLTHADTGTSATPPELLAAITEACPDAQVRVFYGSTEAGSVAALEHRDLFRKPGSCGVVAPSTEITLVDETGAFGADRGELCVRGPLLFDGYLTDAGTVDPARPDGWYHTGDLAERDGEGFLTITGRVGEVIRTGGESVTPAEVEAALLAHPAVRDAAVLGLPDPEWGEVVCAAVVPLPDPGIEPPTLSELREFLEGRLAPYKHPRRLVTVEAIPRTASTLQVQRTLLLERVQSTLGT